MHIIFVTAFFADKSDVSLSGMARYVYKISDLLQKRGHEAEVVAGAHDNAKWKYRNIKIYNAEWSGALSGSKLSISLDILKRENALQKILHEIDRDNPIDIVQYAGWSGIGCMHSLKCPAILRLSTYSKVQYTQHEKFKDTAEIYSFWERLAGKKADGIIAPGEILGRQFAKDISKKVTIMETPFSNEITEDSIIYNNKLRNTKYFLFYGSCSADKGFETIGDMLTMFFEENADMKFVCAGWDIQLENGSAVKKMQKKLGKNADRMLYLGLIKQEQLYSIIRHAEFVLIPSLIDNLPNSCLEALSLDKIVIGTYHTSLEQMICHGKNGFLSKPGDANSLLEAVRRVCVLTEEEKKQIIINNRKRMRKYSPEIAVTKLERYYNWICNEKNRYILLKNKNFSGKNRLGEDMK